MILDNQTLALIAVGASIAANCQPCLEHSIGAALQCGANHQQITEAIDVGKRVMQGAASKMDKFASSLNEAVFSRATVIDGGCECDSNASPIGGKNG
jgi:AhpD family alkylhydroperoxidase